MRKESPAVSIEDCALFSDLPSATLDRIRSVTVERHYGDGETIFHEGDDAVELFILASGRVELSYTLPNDATISLPITKVAPGDLFAWSAAVGGKRLSAKAHTSGESVVYAIPADRFEEVCDADPVSGLRLMRRLAALARTRLSDTRIQLRWLQSYA
jgi:CRP-like cAMP-binding protein